MLRFNPRLAEWWAQTLHLAPAPMYGIQRAVPGEHTVMLDGELGSFAWSRRIPSIPLLPEEARRRAWSSNLRWSIIVDDRDVATVHVWDDPSYERHWPIGSAQDAADLFEHYSQLPFPRAESVIHRALRTFVDVRASVEHRGGTEKDVTLAFNAVMAWVANNPIDESVDFANAVDQLHSLGAIGSESIAIARRLRTFPLGTLIQELKEGVAGNDSHYLLDADLLIRHASGIVYQEAHKWLLKPRVDNLQTYLALAPLVPDNARARRRIAASDIHHTPPALARALVETALRFVRAPDQCDVLDPACGSGVFLVESLRAMHRFVQTPSMTLRGFDRSDIAVMMADVCMRHSLKGYGTVVDVLRLESRDSLEPELSWGNPNLIVMNPPFNSWNSLNARDRDNIRHILGPAYQGRPDTACAFVFRGLESLADGGVLASVVPSTFLESESAEMIRHYVTRSGEYRIHLLGQFGYGVFDAAVQPACLVISRATQPTPVRIIATDEGRAEEAIRALRKLDWDEEQSNVGCDLYSVQQYEVSPDRWTPLPRELAKFADALSANTTTTVADFFVPRLGVRVGGKGALIINSESFRELCRTRREQAYFRPVADRITNGVIQHSPDYLFYPYDESGNLLLTTEQEVRKALPAYFESRLKLAKPDLVGRKSRRKRKWWEVSEPVATWLAKRQPRLVSQEFGGAGYFAFDADGTYAVVQGFGWCWKGTTDRETLLAYLALLNSKFFDYVLSAYCPRVQGGQFVLRRYFVERVPLPRLTTSKVSKRLSNIGRRIHEEARFSETELDSLAREAYASHSTSLVMDNDARLEKRFRQLADQLVEETRYVSRMDRVFRHPLYREIVALGPVVIPMMLRDMRSGSHANWSAALEELANTKPRGADSESARKIVDAWVLWGRDNGFDV